MNVESIKKVMVGVLPLALLFVPADSQAQSCDSTGADGAYSPTTSGIFDPVALKLNAAGDNVFNFTGITIPSGVTITMQADYMKSQRPVVFLVSGPVNIQGALNLSGASGNGSSTIFESRTPSQPGPGGYPGGAGGRPNSAYTSGGVGAGPGGGAVPASGSFGCSASYTYGPALMAPCTAPAVYGNQQLLPLVGGSGGSGGASASANYTGGGGGAGGGAIRICSDVSITANQIYANGGNGGANVSATGEGGAGSGGAIHLQSPSVDVNYFGGNTIQAVGGSENFVGTASVGRIRIDTNSLTGGATNPAPFLSAFLTGPFAGVPLPTPPTLTVVSIDGKPVPAQPLNNYAPPDLTINPAATGPVPIVIATGGIPNNTTATFYVATDSSVSPASPDIVTTATVVSNSVTLNVTLPPGVNRIFVRAAF